MMQSEQNYPLYCPSMEHDSCGIGAVISIRGEQSHRTVDDALKIVEKLQHRAGKDACGETGDGVGLMMQIPHRLMVKAAREIGIEDLGAARSYGVGMFFLPQGEENAGDHCRAPWSRISRMERGPGVPGGVGKDRTGSPALYHAVLCAAPGPGSGGAGF